MADIFQFPPPQHKPESGHAPGWWESLRQEIEQFIIEAGFHLDWALPESRRIVETLQTGYKELVSQHGENGGDPVFVAAWNSLLSAQCMPVFWRGNQLRILDIIHRAGFNVDYSKSQSQAIIEQVRARFEEMESRPGTSRSEARASIIPLMDSLVRQAVGLEVE